MISTETLITLVEGSVATALVSFSTLASWSALRPARTTDAPARAQTDAAAYKRERLDLQLPKVTLGASYCTDSSIRASDNNDLALPRVDRVGREYIIVRLTVHSFRKLKRDSVHVRINLLSHVCKWTFRTLRSV